MAFEELMRELPKGFERVSEHGPFFVNKINQTVEVLTSVLVTCGGPSGISDATELAQALNTVCDKTLKEMNRTKNFRYCVQKALLVLIMRVSSGQMTKNQFFEAMEAWEKMLRDNWMVEYTEETLLKVAVSHCL